MVRQIARQPGPAILSSAMFTQAEVFRWFVGRSLQGLSAVEFDDVVTVLTTSEAEGRSLFETTQRLERILLEARFTWQAVDHWRREFQDAAERPAWLPVFDPRGGPDMRREEIQLLAQSAMGVWYSARNLASMIEAQGHVPDLQVEVQSGVNEACPICQPHVGQRFNPRQWPDEGIPPYHPACACLLVGYRAEWASVLEQGREEREREIEARVKTWSPQAQARWREQQRGRRKEGEQ
jgi:hypothetical protein